MKWSTKNLNELNSYIIDNNSTNVKSLIRQLRVDSLLSDTNQSLEFPYHTKGDYIRVPVLKKPFINFDYTKEEIEFLYQLSQDATLLSQFIKIPDGNGGTVNFDLYQAQKDFVKNYTSKMFNIVKHSRQVGMSNLMTLITLHYIITKKDKTIIWIFKDAKTAFDRFINFLSQIPTYISPGVINFDYPIVKFDNGCEIIFDKSEPRRAIDFVVIDNAGYYELDKALTSLIPRLCSSEDTQIFIVSSPNKNSYFEILFSDQENRWSKSTMNWNTVPGRDSKWVMSTSQMLGGYQKFLEEYDVGDIGDLRDLTIDLLTDPKLIQ